MKRSANCGGDPLLLEPKDASSSCSSASSSSSSSSSSSCSASSLCSSSSCSSSCHSLFNISQSVSLQLQKQTSTKHIITTRDNFSARQRKHDTHSEASMKLKNLSDPFESSYTHTVGEIYTLEDLAKDEHKATPDCGDYRVENTPCVLDSGQGINLPRHEAAEFTRQEPNLELTRRLSNKSSIKSINANAVLGSTAANTIHSAPPLSYSDIVFSMNRKKLKRKGNRWEENEKLGRCERYCQGICSWMGSIIGGAFAGAVLFLFAVVLLSTTDDIHGGGRHSAPSSGSGTGENILPGENLVHGAAITLGRFVADNFPVCTLKDGVGVEEGSSASSCLIRPILRMVEDLDLRCWRRQDSRDDDKWQQSTLQRQSNYYDLEDCPWPPWFWRGRTTKNNGSQKSRSALRHASAGPGLFQQTTNEKHQRQRWHPKRSTARRRATNGLILGGLGGGTDGTGSAEGSKTYLVVAGQMVVEDGECNIAQLDLSENEWSMKQRIQLSLYNSYSGGEVYSLLANRSSHSVDMKSPSTSGNGMASKRSSGRGIFRDTGGSESEGGSPSPAAAEKPISELDVGTGKRLATGELIVVGAFDTTYRNSQVTYCSVGRWDGSMLNKVGEGLCNSALSKGMKITSAAFAGPNDVYVAGSFHTQVWNGQQRQFVKIFNIAHFNAVEQVWLPLEVGQLTCSWCVVTVLALAWDSKRKQLHVAGKFNAIDNRNVPAGLAIYNLDSGHLVAHPGGGLTLNNITEDGVGTALVMDEEKGVLYVMGSFERLSQTKERCLGLAAYEVASGRWTCIADPKHTVEPTGGGNMILTPYGLMVAGKVQGDKTTWPHPNRPYTIALLTTTHNDDVDTGQGNKTANETLPPSREFVWSWLPGFDGHEDPIHCLSNGYNEYEGTVFIGGDNFVAKWSYEEVPAPSQNGGGSRVDPNDPNFKSILGSPTASKPLGIKSSSKKVPVTTNLATGHVRGSVMAIAQLVPPLPDPPATSPEGIYVEPTMIGYTILVYCIALGALFGMVLALLCNKSFNASILGYVSRDAQVKGFSLDTLTYSAVDTTNVSEAYQRAMKTRSVDNPHRLCLVNPAEIIVHRIIGEGTFGRVWSAKWRRANVAVKEFVFAQAAVAGRSCQQEDIIDEIIGEAGMMAMLRHPNVLQLFGCCLTSQAIWIVSELCSLGSLRQLLDNKEREMSLELRLQLALNVADGMTYLHTQDPPIIHRDLKSHNIFVHETIASQEIPVPTRRRQRTSSSGSEGQRSDSHASVTNGKDAQSTTSLSSAPTVIAKIGDWGSARATLSGSQKTMTHGVGTACWLAPEVIKHSRASKQSDVFGFGIILWELATRKEVYEGMDQFQIIARVANENLRPELPERCVWKDLMVKCWDENPRKRPSFGEIGDELVRMLSWAKNRSDSDWSVGRYQESYQGSRT